MGSYLPLLYSTSVIFATEGPFIFAHRGEKGGEGEERQGFVDKTKNVFCNRGNTTVEKSVANVVLGSILRSTPVKIATFGFVAGIFL